jgi:lipid II:glycine glycyltransferase (peptidoglycan interpeptide bridge formation enzyme)
MLYFALGMTKELSTEEKFAALFAHIEYLQSEIDRLKERLAKYENPKNSKNSSKPPSSDFPKQQKTQSLREPSVIRLKASGRVY